MKEKQHRAHVALEPVIIGTRQGGPSNGTTESVTHHFARLHQNRHYNSTSDQSGWHVTGELANGRAGPQGRPRVTAGSAGTSHCFGAWATSCSVEKGLWACPATRSLPPALRRAWQWHGPRPEPALRALKGSRKESRASLK